MFLACSAPPTSPAKNSYQVQPCKKYRSGPSVQGCARDGDLMNCSAEHAIVSHQPQANAPLHILVGPTPIAFPTAPTWWIPDGNAGSTRVPNHVWTPGYASRLQIGDLTILGIPGQYFHRPGTPPLCNTPEFDLEGVDVVVTGLSARSFHRDVEVVDGIDIGQHKLRWVTTDASATNATILSEDSPTLRLPQEKRPAQ